MPYELDTARSCGPNNNKLVLSPGDDFAKLRHIIFENSLNKRVCRFCTPTKSLISFRNENREYVQAGPLSANSDHDSYLKDAPKDVTWAIPSLLSEMSYRYEQSLSIPGLQPLSKAGSDGNIGRLCQTVASLYGAEFARLSISGTSGSLLTTFIAILPKLQPNKNIVLLDENAHSSAYGGVQFGRWKYATVPRRRNAAIEVDEPINVDDFIKSAEQIGPDKLAAILCVSPDYDGFSRPSGVQKLIEFATAHGITPIVDAAWGSMSSTLPMSADIVVTSPHKRGLTPSPVGAFFTPSVEIAELYDQAMTKGFASTSLSFLQLMATEYMLGQTQPTSFREVHSANLKLRKKFERLLRKVLPAFHIVEASDVSAEMGDPAHLLIALPGVRWTGWQLAERLSKQHRIHCEKADTKTILFLLSPTLTDADIDHLITALKESAAYLNGGSS